MSDRLRRRLSSVLILSFVALAVLVLVAGRGGGEDRTAQLEQRLRCPVCKSVSIADSPSPTAASMRRIVASQVAQGRSDEQILDYFTTRYGGWVVMDAPPSGLTLPLWLIVGAGAALGAGVLLAGTARRRRSAPELTAADDAQVQAALAEHVSLANEVDDEP